MQTHTVLTILFLLRSITSLQLLVFGDFIMFEKNDNVYYRFLLLLGYCDTIFEFCERT